MLLIIINKETISNLLLDDLIEDLANIKNISIFPQQHDIIANANFVFAILNGDLYVKPMKHSPIETRGSFTRLSLYILTKKYNIANCFAGIFGIHTDIPPSQGSSNALFSFSRLSGSKYPPFYFLTTTFLVILMSGYRRMTWSFQTTREQIYHGNKRKILPIGRDPQTVLAEQLPSNVPNPSGALCSLTRFSGAVGRRRTIRSDLY